MTCSYESQSDLFNYNLILIVREKQKFKRENAKFSRNFQRIKGI